jgi:hypothetical protein
MYDVLNIVLTAIPYLATGWLFSRYPEWADSLQEHIDEGGLRGLAAAHALGNVFFFILMVLSIGTLIALFMGASLIGIGLGVFGGIVAAGLLSGKQ